MNPEQTVLAAVVGFFVVSVLGFMFFMKPRKLNKADFMRRWRELQALCSDKDQWSQAILDADELLDEALRAKRFEGKTVGERLVSAKKKFSDNDNLWKAHKLAEHIREVSMQKTLMKKEVQQALLAFRKGLRDLEVLDG